MSNVSNKVHLFVGPRQSGKTNRAIAALYQWKMDHYVPDSRIHCLGYNDPVMRDSLELLNTQLRTREGPCLVAFSRPIGTAASKTEYFTLDLKAQLTTQLNTHVPQCFYFQDVPVEHLQYIAERASEYTQHTFVVELWTD